MRRTTQRAVRIAVVGVLLAVLGCHRKNVDESASPPAPGSERSVPLSAGSRTPVPPDGTAHGPEGLLIADARSFRGYTLLAPLTSHDTWLIDSDGKVVHTWHADSAPAMGATLLENGNLLRACVLPENERSFGHAGVGGRVQELSWSGEIVWDILYGNDRRVPHHDAVRLPNGNVLLVVGERFTAAEATAAGRQPATLDGDYLVSDAVVEIKPTSRFTGEVVWEWRVWDHLVQESDPAKRNYGSVADHPELIDLNFTTSAAKTLSAPGPDLAKLQSLGYAGAAAGVAPDAASHGDWTHLNSVAYNAERDEIAVTGLGFSEVWIIDHSTTRAEAAGHSGGRSGMGGDLLYRWGNPRAYQHGTTADQRLVGPHSAHWIPPGLPGAGHVLVFNNGSPRPDERASSVEEIELPVVERGRYARPAKAAFGPEKAVWSYKGDRNAAFYSATFSGAQRLPNGNTLACLGLSGTLVEVTREGAVVWKYVIPSVPPDSPGSGTPIFRAPRYAPDYAGLVGKTLTPLPTPLGRPGGLPVSAAR